MKKGLVLVKQGFTLMEMLIVLVIIGILMAATMKFWSNRIVDLKAQSIKEAFVGYYNDIYSQNMTSSFRDGQKYQKLSLVMGGSATWVYYLLDTSSQIHNQLSDFQIKNLHFQTWSTSFPTAKLLFVPYHFWCEILNGPETGNILHFTLFVPDNGKQYCFEIASETCKLIEQRCSN